MVALAFALSLPAATAGASSLEGALEVTSRLALDGDVSAETDRGLAHLYASSGEADAALEAEELTVEIGWEEGVWTQRPDGSPVAFMRGDNGTDIETFTEAEGELARFERDVQILAFEGEGASFEVNGEGGASSDIAEDELLTRHWFRPNENDTFKEAWGDSAPNGFWYTLEGPWPSLEGLDQATVTGNFSVFVNNVTIEIEGADRSWESWAGFRTEDPDSPAGPLENPTAKEYRIHVVLLHVTNGVLTMQGQDVVDFYAPPEFAAELDGSVRADEATGELLADQRRYLFSNTPLEMEGEGRLQMSTTPAGGSSTGSASDSHETDRPRLNVNPSGDFEVEPTPGLETEATAVQEDASLLQTATSGPMLGALGALGGLLLVFAAVATAAPRQVHVWASQRRADWRAKRYRQWVDNALEHEELHEYERAAKWWARVTEHYPERRYPWLRLAMAHFESGNATKSLQSLHEARDALNTLPVDFLELWVASAWSAGKPDEAKSALLRLAEHAPEMARHLLIQDPAYQRLREDPAVKEAVEEADGPGTAYV